MTYIVPPEQSAQAMPCLEAWLHLQCQHQYHTSSMMVSSQYLGLMVQMDSLVRLAGAVGKADQPFSKVMRTDLLS